MKHLILICIALFFSVAFAQNYAPLTKGSWSKTYVGKDAKSRCEAEEGVETCFEITGKDLRKWKIGQVEDKTSPIFRAIVDSSSFVSCEGLDDCTDMVDPTTCPQGEIATFDRLENHPQVEELGTVEGPWFVWCQKQLGFKKVPGLVEDPQGAAEANRQDQEAKQKRGQKRSKRDARKAALLACVDDLSGAATADRVKECLLEVVREIKEEDIPVEKL